MKDLFKVYAARCPMKCVQEARKGAHKESMSTQEVFVQQFARLFHHYQEALLPEIEQPSAAQTEAWKTVPPDERDRMVTAARLAILELETNARMEDDSRKYFAKPGQAEWGC
jgi:predicted metal-binding protein